MCPSAIRLERLPSLRHLAWPGLSLAGLDVAMPVAVKLNITLALTSGNKGVANTVAAAAGRGRGGGDRRPGQPGAGRDRRDLERRHGGRPRQGGPGSQAGASPADLVGLALTLYAGAGWGKLAGSQEIVCGAACCSCMCAVAACCMLHAASPTDVWSRLGAVTPGFDSSGGPKGLS